jgi:hypothetical protein
VATIIIKPNKGHVYWLFFVSSDSIIPAVILVKIAHPSLLLVKLKYKLQDDQKIKINADIKSDLGEELGPYHSFVTGEQKIFS